MAVAMTTAGVHVQCNKHQVIYLNKLETVNNSDMLQNQQHAILTPSSSMGVQFVMQEFIHDHCLHAKFHLELFILSHPKIDDDFAKISHL